MFLLEKPLTYHQVFTLIAGSFSAALGWSVLQTCSLCLTSVTVAKYAQAYPEDSVSAVVETTLIEPRVEVKEDVVQRDDLRLPAQIIVEQRPPEIVEQPVRDRDDDWFLLLDVVPRETTYVPPGTRCLEISLSSHLL